jgi:YesN/AraC family two-component response regulator
MDGLALARKARLEQPQLEIIFSSGYGDIKGAALKLGAKILTKPFDLDALRTALK